MSKRRRAGGKTGKQKHAEEREEREELMFESKYNDHFETPLEAFTDIAPLLRALASSLGKPEKELVIYDPYYCKGSMVSHLKELGFETVINRNRDFYTDVEQGKVPTHDVLLTNPPFSGDHKLRLLRFLRNNTKPYVLLLPAYVATKSYWKEFSTPQNQYLYVSPPRKYSYEHPEGTGNEDSPFFSVWFIGGLPNIPAARRALISDQQRKKIAGQQCCTVLDSVEEMVRRGAAKQADKRPNPKRRRKNRIEEST